MKWIKRNISTIIILIIFIVGICLLAYPTVANRWNSFHATHTVANYDAVVEQLDDSQYQEIFESAEKYNEQLQNTPNRFVSSDEMHEQYLSELSVDNSSVIGSINIPTVKINLPIYHGTDEAVLQAGAGHLEGSSLPVGGTGTHSVITGHRGLPSAKLFTDLDKLVEGDYVVLNILGNKLTYQIHQIRIVEPSEVEQLDIDPEKDLLTLVTCTPYGINTHRLLLTGHRVENLPENYNGNADAQLLDSKIVALFVAIPILIVLFIWLMIRYRSPRKR